MEILGFFKTFQKYLLNDYKNYFQSYCDNILETVEGNGVTVNKCRKVTQLKQGGKSTWPNRPPGSGGFVPSREMWEPEQRAVHCSRAWLSVPGVLMVTKPRISQKVSVAEEKHENVKVEPCWSVTDLPKLLWASNPRIKRDVSKMLFPSCEARRGEGWSSGVIDVFFAGSLECCALSVLSFSMTPSLTRGEGRC